jgi:hypothetical protein
VLTLWKADKSLYCLLVTTTDGSHFFGQSREWLIGGCPITTPQLIRRQSAIDSKPPLAGIDNAGDDGVAAASRKNPKAQARVACLQLRWPGVR